MSSPPDSLHALELHVIDDRAVDLLGITTQFPMFAIRRVDRAAPRGLTAAAWRADQLDFWAFDRELDALAAGGEPIRVSAPAELAPAIVAEILTRAQRLAPRRTVATAMPWFARVLELHRALHDTTKPLVRADLDHAVDAWQWTLRLDVAASASVQLATLLHDIERLSSEADERIEHHAPDYQVFKDAHARAGARLAQRVLDRADVPAAITAEVVALVEVHERRSEVLELRILNDADGLSFFSLNSPGYLRYFGADQTAKKVAYTLGRMSPAARDLLAGVRVPRTVRDQIAAWT